MAYSKVLISSDTFYIEFDDIDRGEVFFFNSVAILYLPSFSSLSKWEKRQAAR